MVIGAGGATRDLLRRLGVLWEITVVDTDAARLAEASRIRGIEAVMGDGSSRVVLERAGIGDADALVAATNDDDVNLEVCRLGKDLGLLRIVAVAATPERLPDYRDLDVSAVSPHGLTARELEISLEPRRVSSTAFAHGRAEAIEFRIAADSPVRGIALRDLHAESWLIAAILRDDQLIVPHGNAVLKTGDLVTVVGAAADFSLIVRTFTAGTARFPLDFGKRVAVVLDSESDLDTLDEAIYVTRNTQAASLLLVHRRQEGVRDHAHAVEIDRLLEAADARADGVEMHRRPVSGPPLRSLQGVTVDESVGVVVLPAPQGGFLGRPRVTRAIRLATRLALPVLFARGSHPYQRVVAPTRDTAGDSGAATAAIDIASFMNGSVAGVAVMAPTFRAGSDDREAAVRALTRLREEGAVRGVTVRRRLRQGNPVRVLSGLVEESELIVMGLPSRPPSWARPGLLGHLMVRSVPSLLVVPPVELMPSPSTGRSG
jgi:Trk K+ transport system NAD-binding subunit